MEIVCFKTWHMFLEFLQDESSIVVEFFLCDSINILEPSHYIFVPVGLKSDCNLRFHLGFIIDWYRTFFKWLWKHLRLKQYASIMTFFSQFVSGRYSTNPAIWLVPRAGSILPIRPAHGSIRSFRTHLSGFRKKIIMLLTSQGRSVLGKLCPPSCGPRPRAQFFLIRTSRLVNDIYLPI